MNKEYLKKHNLIEAHKQFMRLSEGYLATALAEDDKEDEMQPQGAETPSMDNIQGGDEDNMPDQDNFGADEPNMPQDEPAADSMPQDGVGPMPMDEPELDDDADESVLDVDDLTNAQEKLNDKQNELGHDLGELDGRIGKILTAVEKLYGAIDKNNSDLANLKSELEKRVPTDTEKLDMQSLKMYPYNVSPNNYWKDKENEGRYEAEDKEKEYKLTKGEVEDFSPSEVEKSFDELENPSLRDIFKNF